MVLCDICRKVFGTEAGLLEHVRRKRCRGPPRNNEGHCPICDREFKSFAGMRLHMSKAHPREYNRNLEERYEPQGGAPLQGPPPPASPLQGGSGTCYNFTAPPQGVAIPSTSHQDEEGPVLGGVFPLQERTLRARIPPPGNRSSTPPPRQGGGVNAVMPVRRSAPAAPLQETAGDSDTGSDDDDMDLVLRRMAEMEAVFEGRFINQHIRSQFPRLSIDQIKYRRKLPMYKDYLNALVGVAHADIEEIVEGEDPAPQGNFIITVNNSGEGRDISLNSQGERGGIEGGVAAENNSLRVFNFSQGGIEGDLVGDRLGTSVVVLDEQLLTPNSFRNLTASSPLPDPVDQGEVSDPHSRLRDYLRALANNPEYVLDVEDLALLNAAQTNNRVRHLAHVKGLVDRYIKALVPPIGGRGKSNGQRRGSARIGRPDGVIRMNRSQKRATLFRRVQAIYKKNRKRAAEHILGDIPWEDGSGEGPKPEDAEEEYRGIFGEPSKEDQEVIGDTHQRDETLEMPITVEEIRRAMAKVRSNAVGPDGVKPSHLKQVAPVKLCILFNILLLFGVCPNSLKTNRTILIPKGGDPTLIGNYRPITISSAFSRLLNRIIAERLSLGLPLNKNQRGFRRIDGVVLNNLSLQAIIKTRRAERSPYHLLSLDLRKAFDTVSHDSVSRALRRFGVGDVLSKYILDSYDGSSTTIYTGGGNTRNIPINRGVRQGDPLSPILFNMVLDELLVQLEATGKGIPINNARICVLGYADDLIIAAESQKHATRLLKHTTEFFGRRGMSLNATKSVALSVNVNRGNKHIYTVSRGLFCSGGQFLTQCQPGDFFKYLGRRYGDLGQSAESITNTKLLLERIRRAPLRPNQRLEIIKGYLIPRLLDSLQGLKVTLGILKETDKLIRKAVREFLHLNRSCQDAFIHASIPDGGLGVLSLRKHVPMILLNRIRGLRREGTEASEAVLGTAYSRGLEANLSRWCGESGVTSRGIKKGWADALERGYSGNGLRQGSACSESGSWVSNPPPFWSGRDYIKSIQLRGNLLPTKGIPSNPPAERLCRAGCGRVESLSHVLQRCWAAKAERIARHDTLVNHTAKIARTKGWDVEIEPRIRARNGLLRVPDLTLVKGDTVVVCDAAVSWEGPDALHLAGANKIAHYSNHDFVLALQAIYPGKVIKVAPLILGARGIWCANTNAALSDTLGLNKHHKRELVCKAIMGSIITYNAFMRR